MAIDTRSIVITLKLDQGTDQGNTDEAVDTSAASSKNDKGSVAKAVAAFAVKQGIEIVATEVVNWADYAWNKELTLADDYIGQRNKNIAITQINRGIGIVSNIGSFAIGGAAIGGPGGAVVGAIVGAASSALNIVRSNLQAMDQQNIMLRQMNAQLDYTRQRAGWSVEAASIGEDL